jgi:hypothetical protein
MCPGGCRRSPPAVSAPCPFNALLAPSARPVRGPPRFVTSHCARLGPALAPRAVCDRGREDSALSSRARGVETRREDAASGASSIPDRCGAMQSTRALPRHPHNPLSQWSRGSRDAASASRDRNSMHMAIARQRLHLPPRAPAATHAPATTPRARAVQSICACATGASLHCRPRDNWTLCWASSPSGARPRIIRVHAADEQCHSAATKWAPAPCWPGEGRACHDIPSTLSLSRHDTGFGSNSRSKRSLRLSSVSTSTADQQNPLVPPPFAAPKKWRLR